jgi:hypothetical protein
MRSYAPPLFSRAWWTAVVIAALAAGILATVFQVALWALFTDAWPGILFRDARLAAAIVLGPSVLPPPDSFHLVAMVVATAVHFALSLAYAAAVGLLVARTSTIGTVIAGALFGVALFVVNMYAFTSIFPWFEQTRDWITAAAHVAFGVIAAVAFRWRA